jgi:hypothetical protein
MADSDFTINLSSELDGIWDFWSPVQLIIQASVTTVKQANKESVAE